MAKSQKLTFVLDPVTLRKLHDPTQTLGRSDEARRRARGRSPSWETLSVQSQFGIIEIALIFGYSCSTFDTHTMGVTS